MIVGVTGGTGFVGKCLVEFHAKRGDNVRILTRRPRSEFVVDGFTQLIEGDLTEDGKHLHALVDGLDVLYHCAGEINDPGRMRALHIDGTSRLVSAASGRIGRWVQLSSVGVYGPHLDGVITEGAAFSPIGEYEVTKAAADAIIVAAGQAGSFDQSIIRPSIIYGPAMRNRSLFQLIRLIDRRMFFFIGRPGASANYVHVNDVVAALYLAATKDAAVGRDYIVSDWTTIESVVNVIASELGQRAPTLRVPETPARAFARIGQRFPGFPLTGSRVDALVTRTRYSTERITSELEYRPSVLIEEGIRELTAYTRLWRTRAT